MKAKCAVCGKWLVVTHVTKRNPAGRFRPHNRRGPSGVGKPCYGYPIEDSLTPRTQKPTYRVVLDYVPD